MDADQVKGKAKEAWGNVEEGVGDATDNPDMESEGQQDQAEGKLQQGWGETKEAARDLVDDDR